MRTQRGLAVITALLIVAIAAAAAALMLSQQSAMLDQTSMVVARAQADAYAQAGIDWARGVLAQDSPVVDSLDEAWAKPIAALPVERAVVSGSIVDEQGKFNLNNLGRETTAKDLNIFRSLLGALGLPAELTESLKAWMGAEGPDNAYYLSLARPYRAANGLMLQVDELYRVRGFDAAAVAKLRPYVTALPTHTAINVNTASDALLVALLGAAPNTLAAIRTVRQKSAFKQPQEFMAITGEIAGLQDAIDVKSGYFLVRVQVAQDDVQLASDALVRRAGSGAPAILWRRPRY